MLRIPSFRKIGDLTVYQDDAAWIRFYLMPSLPTIRRDESGRPIFLLTVFHRSDQAREEGGPDGGGFMNFDTQFAVAEPARNAARVELQGWVDEEYARRRSDPQYKSLPEYAAAEAPKVEFADPLLSGGTVSMNTTQSTQLVTGRFAEAPASLVSGSTAVFSCDLTEDGASFMKQLFLTPAGTGRIDLTPVQVLYNLRMWARLPPVTITVTGDSDRIHTTLQKLSETTKDNVCTLAEIENYRETGSNSSTLRETGMVTVKTDKGDATVPNDVLLALEQYALDLFDTMIKEKFLVKADGTDEPFDFQDSAPKLRPASAVTRTSRFRIRQPGNSRYKVRETVNHSTMHLEIRIERSQVVEWPTGGQATLATFFGDASAEELKRHVVDLTASDFNSLGVTVRAIVDFETQPAQAVEVQLEYTGQDSNGQMRTTPGAFTFRAGEMAPARFDPTVLGGKREYRFRTRTIFDDGTATDYTPWETSSSRALNVTVADPSGLAIEISGASLNWDLIRGVKAALTYNDPADGTRRVEKTFELTKMTPIRKWEQRFNRQAAGSVQARLTYFLADDKVVEGEPASIALTDSLFIVPPPQVDVLNVSLVPAGDWSEVAQAVVLMKYDAGEGRIYDKTFRFNSLDQLAEWAVLLRDPGRRTFQYQTVITYKGGTDEQSQWISRTGDQAVLIQVKGVPKLRVNVLSNLVVFERTPLVKVTLTYGEERTTLSFISPGAGMWEVPLAADGRREYAYEITWHPQEGNPISSGLQRSGDTQLFIPRSPVAVGMFALMVRGFADWVATPFVDVAVEWGAGGVNEQTMVTLSAAEPQKRIEIHDVSQRKFRYAITYNLADGTRVAGPKEETTDPVISVTRLQR